MGNELSYKEKEVNLKSKKFWIRVLPYENGNFVSITEGSKRLGSLVVSLGAVPKVTTVTVIPSKTGSLFLQMLSERLAAATGTVCIVSLDINEQDLDVELKKNLLNYLMELVK